VTNLDKKIKTRNLGPIAVCDELYDLVVERATLITDGNISGYIRTLIASDLTKLPRFEATSQAQALIEILTLLD
jgi:hypothetical protein